MAANPSLLRIKVLKTSFMKSLSHEPKHFVVTTMVIAGEVPYLINNLIVVKNFHKLMCLLLAAVFL